MAKLLTKNEVCELVGCTARYLEMEVKRGNLKKLKFGKMVRFAEDEVQKWIKRKTVAA